MLTSLLGKLSLPLGLFGSVAIERMEEKPPNTKLQTDDAAAAPRKRQAWLNDLRVLCVTWVRGGVLAPRGCPVHRAPGVALRGKGGMAPSRNPWGCRGR